MNRFFTSIDGQISNKKIFFRGGCPNCNIRTKMLLVEIGGTPKVFYFPTIMLRKKRCAVCCSCGKSLSVSKELYRKIKHHPQQLVFPNEFGEVYNSPLFSFQKWQISSKK